MTSATWPPPLLRAQQTAGAIAERTGLPIATDDRLIEADNVFAGTQVTGRGRQPVEAGELARSCAIR